MYRPCDPPDLDDLGDGFLCQTCNTVFETEKSWDFHEPCPKTPKINAFKNTVAKKQCEANIWNPQMQHIGCNSKKENHRANSGHHKTQNRVHKGTKRLHRHQLWMRRRR